MFNSLEKLFLKEKILEAEEKDTMLGILRSKYLDKVIELEEFDNKIRELLIVDESDSILEYNLHDAIHNGFSYQSNFANSLGFDFKFQVMRNIGLPGEEIMVKIIAIGEY
jgi:TPP-dependent indolepyruvate ferredoxin oxidoreductase alpha subunit